VFVLALLVSLAVPACTGDGSEAGPTADEEPPAGEVQAAREAIAAATLDDPESVGAVNAVRFSDAGNEAAAQAIGSGATGDELWAAVWVYASSGSDPAVLTSLLDHEDPTIRLMSGAALVSLGDTGGFDALVELIAFDDTVRGSSPPVSVGRFAVSTLERVTQAGIATDDRTAPAQASAAWAAWLEEHRATLRFDGSTGIWEAG
jgi:hypothetical protein